ncbi:general transcriptional corepressor trfA [Bactrocera dorsalis]|uniref:General transcriptional corepressor trfA n=1 Tax=Bactrocera dorsalis TaxID=27457 RepID=A0A6I9VM03_BACDO|nr:general transcriptional corepressor trfA [Bactrocera dorsalis]XP_011213403.2 general transcriptional corepressor trfA [Bactrocera dorsalis]XP_019848355.2 general transcriptional corepressor trfA [Bactrocera dorsalis]XP_049307516.1 general transcriptional corepressor trfA [Bactrocera dorsalis]XP_049307518.1 general transcriptional corepressor trfA [Bactrocera dorsalis]XP_049307519.1 general transcriptional corepressor trfA [Bactrocera dorsalis]
MSDTLSRVKLQLRPVNGSVLNGNGDDKSPPSPATKLLINHGKPNYTIQRSPKAQQNGGANPLNNELQNNNRNNYYPYKSAGVKGTTGVFTNGTGIKTNGATNNNNNNNNNSSSNSSQNGDELIIQSTKFNGVFKPANVQRLESTDEADNPVVLRRVPKPEATPAPAENGNDENVPEFILRQRRIQERLAKENILDFENRRSGYFTHVVISPSSPNRQSLVETMSSPPIVPSLEIPPPAKEAREASIAEENNAEVSAAVNDETPAHEESVAVATSAQVEEEEVAKAIEEVNKAVAGEVDDEKPEEQAVEETVAVAADIKVDAEEQAVAEHKIEEQQSVTQEESKPEVEEQQSVAQEESKIEVVQAEEPKVEELQTPVVTIAVTSAPSVAEEEPKELSAEATVAPTADLPAEPQKEAEVAEPAEVAVVTTSAVESVEVPKENGVATAAETPKTNGHAEEDVTISHTNGVANGLTNGHATPSLPTPDPSGALGVNYEPKTVVSFSKDLDAPNKYPDTVKVTKTAEDNGDKKTAADPATEELKELAKLKFDIKADENDVQVTPVLRTD